MEIVLPNQESIRILGKNRKIKSIYESVGSRYYEASGDKKENEKNYLRWTHKFLETKHSRRHRIKGINVWSVRLVSDLKSFLNEQGKNLDKRTRRQESWWKCTKPYIRKIWQTLYVHKKGRSLHNIEDSMNALIRGHEDYIKKSKESLLKAACNSTHKIRAERRTIITKQKWKCYIARYTNMAICEMDIECS